MVSFPEKPANSPALAAMNQFLALDDNGVCEFGVTPAETHPSDIAPPPQPHDLPDADTETRLMEWLPRLRVYRHNLEDYFFNERMRGEVAHRTMEHLTVSGDDQKRRGPGHPTGDRRLPGTRSFARA